MTEGEPAPFGKVSASPGGPEPRRERVVVKRRRSRASRSGGGSKWVARPSRRQRLRMLLVCTAVLAIMAIGLYFGLSQGDGSTSSTAKPGPAPRAAAVAS